MDKKYLITSNYHLCDNFDFSNVCVCDTKEQAEKMVADIKAIKEILLDMKGLDIYINRELSDDEIINMTFDYFPDIPNLIKYNSNSYRCFLTIDDYNNLKSYNFEVLFEINFFNFAALHISGGPLDKKGFLNDAEAIIGMEEINYFKLKEIK